MQILFSVLLIGVFNNPNATIMIYFTIRSQSQSESSLDSLNCLKKNYLKLFGNHELLSKHNIDVSAD